MINSSRTAAVLAISVGFYSGLFFNGEALAQSCKDWSTNCKSLQALRESQSHKHIGTKNYRCETSLSHMGSVGLTGIDAAKKILQSANLSGGFDNQKFMACLEDVDKTILSHRKKDDELLRGALEESKIVGVSLDELKAVFFSSESDYALRKEKIAADNPEAPWYRDYTLNGSYQAMEESLRGTRVVSLSDGTRVEAKKYERSGLDELQELRTPGAIFNHLKKRAFENQGESAAAYPVSPRTVRPAITPAVAKLILFEVLREKWKQQPDRVQALLGQVSLKFDYNNPNSERETNLLSTSLHNGYFLGSTPENFPTREAVPKSTGTDCTAMIQRCQKEAGLAMSPDFKLLSSRVVSMARDPNAEAQFPEIAEYKSLYSVRPYECEADLEPGDTVVFPGHAFVFQGYKRDAKGALQIATYEAIAGEYRSAGSTFREIYPGDVCESPAFSSGGEKNAYVLRVKPQIGGVSK
ncbi:MAG: hypothetical protein J0L82_18170 [Deltaproteobacteria bacterium]|nr:hypothetical protein [Deltaproteobacteria bacterium]